MASQDRNRLTFGGCRGKLGVANPTSAFIVVSNTLKFGVNGKAEAGFGIVAIKDENRNEIYRRD